MWTYRGGGGQVLGPQDGLQQAEEADSDFLHCRRAALRLLNQSVTIQVLRVSVQNGTVPTPLEFQNIFSIP